MKKSDFDRLGGWPAASDPTLVRCGFYGVPTLNPSTGNFRLPANGYIQVQLGDLFDETGMYGSSYEEMLSDQDYVFRAYAEASGTQTKSGNSTTVQGKSKPPQAGGCVFTQGYWKNHPATWPVFSLSLGNPGHAYTKQELLDIFQTPAAGNGLISMAHQLIAAKLNIANGADPSPIGPTVLATDNLIGTKIVPPTSGSSDYIAPSQTSGYTDTLDNYNNGKTAVPHCDSTPAKTPTFGGLKAIYR
jgi:hypothetical protein